MANKININTVKNQNRLLVLNQIIDNIQITRTEIAKKTDLSNATVGTIADEFIELDIISEEKIQTSSIGRKPSFLKLKKDSKLILVIDLVSNDMAYTILSLDLSIEQKYHHKFNLKLNYEKNLNEFLEKIKSYITLNQLDEKIIGISVATAGTYNEKTDMILCKALPPLTKIKLKKKLKKYFTQKISIENDMRLVSIYDIQKVNNYNNKNIIYICLGTGIGGAFSINGNLYRGKNNFAGEIGQIMLSPKKTLEQSVTWEKFITKIISENKNVNKDNIKSFLLNKYQENNDIIKKELDGIISDITQAFTNIIWLLNPDTIVINDQFDALDEFFVSRIKTNIQKNVFLEILDDLEIILIPNKEESLVMGAAYIIRKNWTIQLTSKMSSM